MSAENLTLNACSTKRVRVAILLFCSKCLKAHSVPGVMHNNRTWIHQGPGRRDRFLGEEREGSHSQGEGGLFGSPLKGRKRKGSEGKNGS